MYKSSAVWMICKKRSDDAVYSRLQSINEVIEQKGKFHASHTLAPEQNHSKSFR